MRCMYLAGLLMIGQLQAEPLSQQQLEAEATKRMQSFAGELQSTLMNAIQAGGLEAGVEVCSAQAPEIAKKYSKDGWQLSRTSLKTRNPSNRADAMEKDALMGFVDKMAQGHQLTSLSFTSYNVETQQFVLIKPIGTQAVCLSCHGNAIDPKLHDKIKLLYPEDTATGFSLGDLRGAFVVRYQGVAEQ